jgi:predicted dehydrogenase
MWASWKETSGDILAEQNCHTVDTFNWFCRSHPLQASGAGGRKKRAYGDCSDHFNVTYEYAGGLRAFLTGIQLARNYGEVKEQFFGTQGVVETTRRYYKWYRGQNDTAAVESKHEPTVDAGAAFVESIMSGKPENNAPAAVESSLSCFLAQMSIETWREVTWDEMMRSA